MTIRVADYIPKFIYDNGVRHIFLLSGGGIMHLTDGLACNKDLKTICYCLRAKWAKARLASAIL